MLASCNSVVFHAMQLALFTNPRKIYLVGVDASDTGHFNGDTLTSKNVISSLPKTLVGYRKFKEFASLSNPDTELVSINPVGLAGIYTDMYSDL